MSASETRTLTVGEDGEGRDPERGPCLFLAMESHRPLAPPARIGLAGLDEVVVGRGASRSYEREPRGGRLTVRTEDPWLSTSHARFVKVLGRWSIDDLKSKNGSRLNGEPVTRAALEDGDLLELGRTFFIFRADVEVFPDDPPILEASRARAPAPGLLTLLPSLGRAHAMLETIARAEVPVLLEGETGTGKEVTARAIHALSGRRGECVAINCGALPEALVEGELFGHRRGAFSDAKEDRPGLVRAADRGTLFLDEIGELRPPAQAALLRVLEEREVRPIGATAPVRVDVRFVAATNRGLERMVENGGFRADLFHRLAGHRHELLPLRMRREDLGLVAGALIERHGGANAARVTLNPKAARALFEHGWPGNVRELEKALGSAIVLAGGGEVKLEHLPDKARRAGEGEGEESGPEGDGGKREEIVALLREHKGNVSAVARALGKARMQVQRWMKRFAIDPEQFRK
ncbi:sigma 54-interacting transcriptional regulator [Polyangium aurulentum]|uniref:sigma 54-interacting transcriptional regulator n=1 Tax=Polyangium aurulentum TaxID=2567896 RepID=UPI00146EE43D|nr:sigma 54-interacting transcriptional regulator [Polyangium aurulentum]UQA60761.1 sigma 54-interacting transcriptional regulator [Polyangium aurulentum]